MRTTEERVAHLEGRVWEHGQMFRILLTSLANFEQRVDRRFADVERRFVDVDRRFAEVDRRFDEVDRRFDEVGERLGRLETKLDRIDQKFDARLDREITSLRRDMGWQFRWTVGLVFTGFATVIAAVLSS